MPLVQTLTLAELIELLIVIANRIQLLQVPPHPVYNPPQRPRPARGQQLYGFPCMFCGAPCGGKRNDTITIDVTNRLGVGVQIQLRRMGLRWDLSHWDCTRDCSNNLMGLSGKSALALAPPSIFKKVRLSTPTSAQAGSTSDALLRIKQPSQCIVVQKLWDELVGVLLPFSQLLHDIEHSVHRDHHVSVSWTILQQPHFPSTSERSLTSWEPAVA